MSDHRFTVERARAAVAEVLPSVRADLDALVRIPSVSADPAAAGEVQRSAQATAELLRGAGFADVRIASAGGGAPAVLARRPAPPGAPTVLLYAHHDVQPTGPRAGWHSDPFTPTERDGRLYGRGTADDKAGIAAHLAAVRALGDELAVGVTVLIEGEEEIGSPSLAAFLAEQRETLAADVLVLADGTNWRVGVPGLTTSLRGLLNCVVEVRTLDHGVHSGMYGGPVPDALTALCRLLATLHDEAGDVAVAGLPRGDADPLDLTAERLRAEAGVLDGVRLIGTGELTARLWTRPALSVLGVDAPPVDGAPNLLQPVARAKVSLRLPPGAGADAAMAALADHLRAHAPWGAHVSVVEVARAEPFAVNPSGPVFAAARDALRAGWGAEPVEIGVGGSIPFVAAFVAAFPAATILVTGVEDPDTRAHGADESLHLGEFERVCVAEVLLLDALAGQRTG